MSSGPWHRVARPAQYTCPGTARSTWRSARVYVSTASDTTGSPATARACANPATPMSGSPTSGATDIRVSPGQQSVKSGPGDSLQVLVVLDDRTERRGSGLRVENVAIEFTQGPCPIQRLGDAGRLDQFHAAQGVDGVCHLVGQRLRDARDAAAKDRDFARQVG